MRWNNKWQVPFQVIWPCNVPSHYIRDLPIYRINTQLHLHFVYDLNQNRYRCSPYIRNHTPSLYRPSSYIYLGMDYSSLPIYGYIHSLYTWRCPLWRLLDTYYLNVEELEMNNHMQSDLDIANVFDEENIRQWDERELGADERYVRYVPMHPKLRELIQLMKAQSLQDE